MDWTSWNAFHKSFHDIMPKKDDLPTGWRMVEWQRYELPGMGYWKALVYLHDPGCPFLRFYVRHPTAKRLRCLECGGTGRVDRPPREPVFDFFKGQTDEPDQNGQRSCFRCFGQGHVDPIYGYGDIVRLPNFDPRVSYAPPRDQEDVLYVIQWCDDLFNRLNRPKSELEKLAMEEW